MAEMIAELVAALRTKMAQAREAGDVWCVGWADVSAAYCVTREAALTAMSALVAEGIAVRHGDGQVAAVVAL